MNSQKGAFNTHIYGVGNDFFAFQGFDTFAIKPGEVAVNRKLADYLGIKPGDDLIITIPTNFRYPVRCSVCTFQRCRKFYCAESRKYS